MGATLVSLLLPLENILNRRYSLQRVEEFYKNCSIHAADLSSRHYKRLRRFHLKKLSRLPKNLYLITNEMFYSCISTLDKSTNEKGKVIKQVEEYHKNTSPNQTFSISWTSKERTELRNNPLLHK